MSTPLPYILGLAATALLLSTTAHAKSPLDTLKHADDSSSSSAQSIHASSELEPGAVLQLALQKSALTKTSKVTVEPWLTPPSKWRYASIREGENCERFVVVEHHSKVIIGPDVSSQAYILDLESGETFGDFKKPSSSEMFCEGDYMIIGSNVDTPIAFHMPSKELIKPRLKLPSGAQISHSDWIKPIRQESGFTTEFMVRVVDKDRTMYHGVWSLPEDTMSLSSSLPFDGIREARHKGDTIEMLGFDLSAGHHAHKQAMERVYLVDDEAIHTTHSFDNQGSFWFLEGGYSALLDSFNPTIIHPDGEQQEISLGKCHSMLRVVARGHDPVSLLLSCRTSQHSFDYAMAYWTPEAVTTWHVKSEAQIHHGDASYNHEARDKPIVPFYKSIGLRSLNSNLQWFDTRHGVFWEGLASYDISTHPSIMAPSFLATDTNAHEADIDSSKKINLYHIDIDRQQETLLHTYTDCDGKLESSAHHGDLFEVHCVTNPKPGRFQFLQQWSEIIDVKRGVRWRAPKTRFISHVFADGSFAISSLSKGDNLVYPKNRKLWRARLD